MRYLFRRRKSSQRPFYEGPYKQRLKEQLVSWEYGVTGKPDYIVDHDGMPIPVLVKSGNAPGKDAHDSHVAQILVYCLLVHETTKTPPSYGIIRYNDRTFEVDYNEHSAQAVLELLDQIRASRQRNELPKRSHEIERRCYACRHWKICEDSLIS